MITYIHSYQYVPSNILKHIDLSQDTYTNEYFIINKKTNEKIIGLKNIPLNTSKNDGIYKVYLSKLLNKKKRFRLRKSINTCNQINICIYVEINFNKLISFIRSNMSLPSSDSFYLLLRRNFLSEVNQEYSVTLENTNNLSVLKNQYLCIDPNIYIYDGVFFDYVNSRFFLNVDEYKLFQRIKQIPSKDNYIFHINDFDVDGKSNIIKQLRGKTLIICKNNKINSWAKNLVGSYTIIDKTPFNKDLLNKDTIIIPTSFFTSTKYKGFFKSNIGSGSDVWLNESIYNDYLLELISYNRNKGSFNSPILINLVKWGNIILDEDLNLLKENKFLNEMIKLLSADLFIYYCENKKSQINYDDIRKILNQILNIKIKFLNNYILEKYQKHIVYNQSNKKYNDNVNLKYKKLILGEKQTKFLTNLDLDNQIKYICFPNIVKNEHFKLTNNIKNDTNCSICLDSIKKTNMGITSCNHVFCYTCIKRNLLNSQQCPNCRKKLTSNDVYKCINFSTLTYLNENNKVRDILNKTYDLILTKYTSNKRILSSFLSEHGIENTILQGKELKESKESKEPKGILIDDYENLCNIKLKNVLILEPLYSNDRYYKYKLNKVFKNSKITITQYTYNLNLS